MRVLVTGSTGAIGGAVCRELLRAGYEVRGFDRGASELLADTRVGNLADADAVDAAVEGVDAVIHLAATPDEADFVSDILPNNILGTFHVLEAAAKHNVKRVVLTSSCLAVHSLVIDDTVPKPLRIEQGYRTTLHYGLSKIWLEQAGAMYAEKHDMAVVSIRPGHLPRSRATFESIGGRESGTQWYLSPGDAGRCFRLAVESDRVKAGKAVTVFLTSRPVVEPMFDLTPAKEWLGYEPRDTWPQGREEMEPYWQRIEGKA